MLRGEPRMKPDVQYTRNGDVSLAYQVVGDGDRDLLVVSGFVSNLEYAWEYPSLSRFLSRLAESSRLILIDRRGSGLSDRFRDAPTQETMLRDLEIVLDAVGSAKATLFGMWDGCETSTLFAATFPERVASLILFTASAAQKPADDYPWAWNDEEWDGWLGSIRDGWGTRAWVVKNARWMGPGMLDHPDELEAWISYTRVAASPSSAEAVMRTSSETDIREILRVRPDAHAAPASRRRSDRAHRRGAVHGRRRCPTRAWWSWMATMASRGSETPMRWSVRSGRSSESASSRRRPTDDSSRSCSPTSSVPPSAPRRWEMPVGPSCWREHHVRVREELDGFNGVEVDTAGDGFLATFDGPARAVRCARAIGERVRDLGLEIRAGVHVGEIEQVGKDVRGIAVHIGARITALAEPNEILVSSTVRDLVAGSGLTFEDAGEHELKGVPGRWRLFRVVE